jgi:anti-anti-sigma regulatory factor
MQVPVRPGWTGDGPCRPCEEHDLATTDELHTALSAIHGDVPVELSACTFIDSSVIGVLLASAAAQKNDRHRLELLVPDEGTGVRRTLEVSGETKLLTTHAARP